MAYGKVTAASSASDTIDFKNVLMMKTKSNWTGCLVWLYT